LARQIHAWSPRSQAPYAVTSCLVASAENLEDELFGLASESGGDAPPEKLGRMIFCDGGTLVLDEIGAVPLSLQWKLDRFLHEHRYERRDDYVVRQADVRMVATTSIDLLEAVKQNRFRRELLLALDVMQIDIPPLRQRPGDIRPLAERYLAYYSRQNNRRIAGFSNDAQSAMQNHSWPGNHRELRNLIERAVILCDGDYIEIKHFPPNLSNFSPAYQPGDLLPQGTIEDLHSRGVMAAAGTVKGAASILGINYSTLWRQLRKNASASSTSDSPDTPSAEPTDEQPAK
jgi:NtrC-family two-component system response regulator AlgB